MKVLIATDGHIDAEAAATFGGRLAGDDGSVVVFTSIEVPRRLLTDLRAIYSEERVPGIESDAEYVGIQPGGTPTPSQGWPGDDKMIERYLRDKEAETTAPVVEALRSRGVTVTTRAAESESAAAAVVAAAKDTGADVIVIGSHGKGLFEGLLGSTGTKLVRRSPLPVLVLRDGG